VRQVLGSRENVDRVDLHRSDPADGVPELAGADRSGGPGAPEALGGQGNAPRGLQAESVAWHDVILPRWAT